MLLFLCLQNTLALAEEEDPTLALDTSAEETAEPEEDSSGQAVDVRIELVNGMVLSGTAPLQEVLYWEPGNPIRFTPNGGEEVLLEGSRIGAPRMEAATQPAVTAVQDDAGPTPAEPPTEPGEAVTQDAAYLSPRGFSYPNPAASRYLYAPSAIPMKKGQGYVSQKAIFTAGAYAVTDNFTALLGTFTFFPPALTVVGGKYATAVNEKVHVAAGGEAFLVPIDSELAVGVAFGSVTYGDADKHLTVATGVVGGAYIGDIIDADVSIPLMVGGHVRRTERTAFVTENWLVFDPGSLSTGSSSPPIVAFASTAAVRLVGKRDVDPKKRAYLISAEGYPRTTWDIGLAFAVYRESYTFYLGGEEHVSDFAQYSTLGPLPWIDYTWHFGPSG